MRMRSRHSLRTVRTQRSANAFAFGACTGVRITSSHSQRKTLSKPRLNFLSRSRISSPNRNSRSPSCMTRLRACCATQAPSGVGRASDELDLAGGEREEEEHVDPLQRERLDGEEVAGEHAGSLLAQERAPRLSCALGCRWNAGTSQNLAYRGR